MLTARKAPRACQSCRLKLLSLFEHGFTKSTTTIIARSQYSTSIRPYPPTPRSTRIGTVRRFSTTKIHAEEISKDVQTLKGETGTDIEAVVRQARQTFGETLPKDYLSSDEYNLYERLYGPPLRETKADDLMYLPDGEEEFAPEKARNVLLRENSDGEFDEIEFDPELGFSIVEDSPETIAPGDEEPTPEVDDGLSEITMEMEDHEIPVDGKEGVEIQAKD